MDIRSQFTVAPNRLDGKRTPMLWACVALLIAASGFCGAQAWREVPSTWKELRSFDIVPVTAFERIEASEVAMGLMWSTRSEALMLDKNEPLPAALRPPAHEHELPIHPDLKLGFERILALNKNSARWTVSLFDEHVVRIASADAELLPYREFQQAWQRGRWQMTAYAAASALAAALLACSALAASSQRRPHAPDDPRLRHR